MRLTLPDFKKANVLIIGDILLDRYWDGDTSRISPEAPVPVVRINRVEERLGGASNVALNIRALGGNVSLIAIVGADREADVLEHLLIQAQVQTHLIRCPKMPTMTKLRVLSRHQQLIRLDFEDYFHGEFQDELLTVLESKLDQADLVILSDYGKGTLYNPKPFIELCRQHKKTVFVDPKATFEHYQHATLLTPNLKEFEASVGPCKNEDELVLKAQAAIIEHHLEGLLITRGAEGMTLVCRDQAPVQLRAKAVDVFDVTGAGDTVIGAFAASVAAGHPWVESMGLANLAAGIVVRKLGTATASELELRQALPQDRPHLNGVLNEDELLELVKMARHRGERIVMTNGCFDILHPGHVSYLEKAKSLGDRLIVAVNDDASVRRLKGETRPINSTQSRLHVLSALGAVDWVVPFSEDTPERLIQKISPDVLVKGGDWAVDQIVGSDHVLRHGGEVRSLPFVDGHSTTKIIEKTLSGA